jgi:hypothetical protein
MTIASVFAPRCSRPTVLPNVALGVHLNRYHHLVHDRFAFLTMVVMMFLSPWAMLEMEGRGVGGCAPTRSRRGSCRVAAVLDLAGLGLRVLGPDDLPSRSSTTKAAGKSRGKPLHKSYSLERYIRNPTYVGVLGRRPSRPIPPRIRPRDPASPRTSGSGPAAGASGTGSGPGPRSRSPSGA